MVDTARTTIVLPRTLFRRAKIESARSERTLSQFIAAALERAMGGEENTAPELPLGKYRLGDRRVPDREELYAAALRPNLPA